MELAAESSWMQCRNRRATHTTHMTAGARPTVWVCIGGRRSTVRVGSRRGRPVWRRLPVAWRWRPIRRRRRGCRHTDAGQQRQAAQCIGSAQPATARTCYTCMLEAHSQNKQPGQKTDLRRAGSHMLQQTAHHMGRMAAVRRMAVERRTAAEGGSQHSQAGAARSLAVPQVARRLHDQQ